MSAWELVYAGYDPESEGLRESLCTLGNGVFATRGASTDSVADSVHYPGTYLAGGYDRATSCVHGREIENEDLVNFPNWLPLTFRAVDSDWFSIDAVEVLHLHQTLDLRDGLLLRDLRFRDPEGRTTRWRERRLVSMDEPHLAALSIELVAEDWDGTIEIRSGLDGTVVNQGVARYEELESRHLGAIESRDLDGDRILLRARTLQSRLEMAQAARTRVYRGDRPVEAERSTEDRVGWIADHLRVSVGPDEPVRIEKIVAIRSSRDHAISEPGSSAARDAEEADRFDSLARRHARAWHELWDAFDLGLDLPDDEEASTRRRLRIHTFHLLQTVSPHSTDLDVGAPARGWHGEAYRGHIFWDELFVFPVLSMRMPHLVRSLLQYRYRRLPEARRAARRAGFDGAMFPWQSGSDGREESQEIHLNPDSGRWVPDESRRQFHIGAAIAYNVWTYHQATEDYDFLYHFGVELMVEIARFWASLAEYDESLDRFHIRGVMGPDEYHTGYPHRDGEGSGGLDDNAYTNAMASWVLERARDVLDLVPEHRRRRLRDALGLSREEMDRWREISRKLILHFHGDGILSQFRGYEQLEEFDWEGYREKYGDIQRLDRILEAEGDSPNRYKVSKQADVLMLFYLFSTRELQHLFQHMGYRWEPELVSRNIEYYLARTSHGSTLSRVSHSWVLARSDRPRSWRLFRDTLGSDVEDVQGGTTREGIHLGAMAGSLDLVHRCWTGIGLRGNALHLNPCLPREVDRLRLRLSYRRHLLDLDIDRECLTVESHPLPALPITIAYRGRYRLLSPGERQCFELLTPEERLRERRDVCGRE